MALVGLGLAGLYALTRSSGAPPDDPGRFGQGGGGGGGFTGGGFDAPFFVDDSGLPIPGAEGPTAAESSPGFFGGFQEFFTPSNLGFSAAFIGAGAAAAGAGAAARSAFRSRSAAAARLSSTAPKPTTARIPAVRDPATGRFTRAVQAPTAAASRTGRLARLAPAGRFATRVAAPLATVAGVVTAGQNLGETAGAISAARRGDVERAQQLSSSAVSRGTQFLSLGAADVRLQEGETRIFGKTFQASTGGFARGLGVIGKKTGIGGLFK